jgi:lantibiotic transport system ATP-binding protein
MEMEADLGDDADGPAAAAAGDGPAAVETHKLARRFGAVTAVAGLGLRVPRGSVYGFLGPNGAGKTTTIRLLLGLLAADAGEIRLWGTPLARSSREGLLRRVGALVETPSLYPHLTGYENLRVTQTLLGLPRSCIEPALRTVRLTADAGRPVRGYSLGMRQRLGLALALLSDPELLVLDEPTNGLDPAGIQEMRDLIRALPAERGITVFLSSHLLREVEQVATHVGIVQAGRLVFQGPLAELQARARETEALMVEVGNGALAARTLKGAGMAFRVVGDGALRLPATSAEEVARVNALLVSAGVPVYRLAPERASLEETFLRLTGEAAVAA